MNLGRAVNRLALGPKCVALAAVVLVSGLVGYAGSKELAGVRIVGAQEARQVVGSATTCANATGIQIFCNKQVCCEVQSQAFQTSNGNQIEDDVICENSGCFRWTFNGKNCKGQPL